MTSTEPQRRFIESLAKNLTDSELSTAIREAGHDGWAARQESFPGTRNQALKGVTKIQASKLINILKGN